MQTVAYVSSTNVGEACRSNRANSLSYIMKGFNRRTASKTSEKRHKKVKQAEEGTRVSEFAKYIDLFHKKVDRARSAIGVQWYDTLVKHIDGDANKISRVDLEARKVKYSKGIDKIGKTTKSETNTCGIDMCR